MGSQCLKIPSMYNGYTLKGVLQLTALEQTTKGRMAGRRIMHAAFCQGNDHQ